jgi:hypothetical protein
MMTIFEEMHPFRRINSWYEFNELKRMLGEAIKRGHVEVIPVIRRWEAQADENWYREKETGIIFSLITPDPPAPGAWERIKIEDLKPGEGPSQ